MEPAPSVASAATAHQFLYSTTTSTTSGAVGTAPLFTPKTAPPEGGWPLIARAHGTVGLLPHPCTDRTPVLLRLKIRLVPGCLV